MEARAGAIGRFPRRLRVRLSRACALVGLASLSCAFLSPEPRVSEDGLVEHDTRGHGTLFVRPDHHVGDYDRIWLAQVGIHYAPDQRPLPAYEEWTIRQRLEAFRLDVGDDVGAARSSGPCTLQLGVFLKDLEFLETWPVGSQTNYVGSFGSASLVMELRDSETGTALVRYGQRRSIGHGTQGGQVLPTADRLSRAVDAMLEDSAERIAEIVPGTTPARAERGCEGRIGMTPAAISPARSIGDASR